MAADIQTQNNTVGINVEHPNVFMYNGRWYSFTSWIFNSIDKTAESLDNQHVESFEYVNQINQVCLTGSLVYKDIDGTISKFFNKSYNHITVVCQQLEMEQVGNGNGKTGIIQKLVAPVMNFLKSAALSEIKTFQHTFIIENVEILDRVENQITYKLHLISENWYKAISEIEYSNYGNEDSDSSASNLVNNATNKLANKLVSAFGKATGISISGSGNEKNVFVMIKKFLSDAKLKCDEISFKRAEELTKDIKVDYITNGNDNLFTVIPYLMNRLYFIDEFIKLKTFLYIVYDPIDNLYKVINYSDENSWLGVFKPSVMMSMFETSYEQSLFSENNNLGTTTSLSQTDLYESLFTHKYWKYDFSNGMFSTAGTDIDTKSFLDLYNSKSASLEDVDGKTKPKYVDLIPEAFVNDGTYHHQMQDTNNGYRIYNDLVKAFISKDALIVNCEGDITHRPGAAMGIVLDRTVEKEPVDVPKKDIEELYKKHRQIEQIFLIFKSRHMYKLTTPAAYTENVVLSRNFLLTPKEVGKATT